MILSPLFGLLSRESSLFWPLDDSALLSLFLYDRLDGLGLGDGLFPLFESSEYPKKNQISDWIARPFR